MYLTKEENAIIKSTKSKVRALDHPLRQKILTTLRDNGNRMNVTEIYVKLRIEQSVASQHLAILRNQKFVNTERDGKTIWYGVNRDEIMSFIHTCNQVLGKAA